MILFIVLVQSFVLGFVSFSIEKKLGFDSKMEKGDVKMLEKREFFEGFELLSIWFEAELELSGNFESTAPSGKLVITYTKSCSSTYPGA